MIRLKGRTTQAIDSGSHQPLILDASRLREDERLEFKYDQNNNLIAIQKVKLSLLRETMEAKAETNIAPYGVGRVFYQGTSWKARCDAETPIVAGKTVLVRARHDLTLLVIPAAEYL